VIGHLPPYRVEAVAHALPSSGVDWAIRGYGIPALWSRHQGAGVRVAVLDTGVEPGHPALSGAVKEHRNFTSDYTPYDTNGHGTHVAGVLAARGPMTGVAPAAEIISCKVLGNNGSGSLTHVAEAIDFAVEAQVHIIVMSLGCPISQDYLRSACKRAYDAGVAVVCAAGNDGGSVNYPAAYDSVVAVGAVDREGNVCEFSCRGKEIAVAAPGFQITSAWVGGKYATLSGTSMAAPFVAGTLALYAAQCGTRNLSAVAEKALRETSTDAGPPGKDETYGWGLINPLAIVGNGCRLVI
jgi:subtilisin family serine protease